MAFDAIMKHLEWIESIGETGEQIHLDRIDMHKLPFDPRVLEQGFFSECNFSGMAFDGVDFYQSEFYSCDFSNAHFTNCDFRKTTLDYSIFSGAIFENCRFSRADAFQAVFQNCSFQDCSFVGFNLMECDLRSSVLTSIDFDAAYMDKIKCDNSIFTDPKNLLSLNHISIVVGEGDILEGESAIQRINSR